jgi:hypothetical protein
LQAVLQHTPSTQLPERHWVAEVQAMPLGMRATHMPSRQKLPIAHSTSVSQLVRHAVDEQAKRPQSRERAGEQAPRPSQVAAWVSVPFMHEGMPHWTWSLGNAQVRRLEPSHAPAQVPVPVQARRLPRGVPRTGEQVPRASGLSQASHWPVQAVLQHTPSTQLPEAHSAAVVQARPGGMRAAQRPSRQKKPVLQSASVRHIDRQSVGPQTNGSHIVRRDIPQAPRPSQKAAEVATPAAQEAAEQLVIVLGKVHSVRLVPSQRPPQVVPKLVQVVRGATGAPVVALQMPTRPALRHDSHWPGQARSQQTPSVQTPEVHSEPVVQSRPLPRVVRQVGSPPAGSRLQN